MPVDEHVGFAEEPSLVQMQQRLKRCEKSEQAGCKGTQYFKIVLPLAKLKRCVYQSLKFGWAVQSASIILSQEHREAACLAEDHASMLEEKNQKLEEEGCWRGLSWFILKRMFLTHRARCWASG